MLGCLAVVFGVAAVGTALFYPAGAWLFYVVPVAWLLLTYFSVRQQKYKYIPELSPQANAMLQKYGHSYTMPYGSRDFSAAASAMSMSAAVVGIVGALKGFWWGLALAVVTYVAMNLVAQRLNPTSFLRDPDEKAAHLEVIEWVTSKQRQG